MPKAPANDHRDSDTPAATGAHPPADFSHIPWLLTHIERMRPDERDRFLDEVRRNASRLRRFATLEIAGRPLISDRELRTMIERDADRALAEASFISWMLSRGE